MLYVRSAFIEIFYFSWVYIKAYYPVTLFAKPQYYGKSYIAESDNPDPCTFFIYPLEQILILFRHEFLLIILLCLTSLSGDEVSVFYNLSRLINRSLSAFSYILYIKIKNRIAI